jgi:hypothetical protein
LLIGKLQSSTQDKNADYDDKIKLSKGEYAISPKSGGNSYLSPSSYLSEERLQKLGASGGSKFLSDSLPYTPQEISGRASGTTLKEIGNN